MSFLSIPRLLLLASAAPAFAAVTADLPKEQQEFFEKKIAPLLKENCYKCHSLESGKAKGGLTLDTRGGWEKAEKPGGRSSRETWKKACCSKR